MSELENMIFLGIFTIAPLAIFGFIFGKRMFKVRRSYFGEIKPRSVFWFLLPIFGGFIGGMIAYGLIGHDDPQKAKICLLIGFIPTAGFLIAMWVALFVF